MDKIMSQVDSPPRRLPVPEFRVFLRLRYYQVRNSFRLIVEQSTIRLVSILLASLLVWGFVYLVSHTGFRWIASYPQRVPPFGGIVAILLGQMFLWLGGMLIFSTALILYSSLFASPEARFLLATPARDDQVFAYKFLGSLGFSSWGFLLLGSPVLLAYGIVYGVRWPFFVLLPFFFLGFILVPGCFGALASLIIVNVVPKRGKQLAVALGILAIFLVGLWYYSAVRQAREGGEGRETVNQFLGLLSLGSRVVLPTQWMTRGLQEAGQGCLLPTTHGARGALYYLALLWSNGLICYCLTTFVARLLYRRGYNRFTTGSSLRKRYGGAWLDNIISYGFFFLDPQTRLLIIKDFRTFRRDPAQWAQVLIFGGLLLMYFGNIRRLFISEIDWNQQNGISLLNLTTTGLLLCIYTGRFIYPMISLEGRKFWILGLLPLRRERLLWGKFAFAVSGGLGISEALILLSDLMLDMPWGAVGLHALTVAVLAIGLSGLSVGLGACLPTFKENDPSKIAAGFGGTLNLVAGMLFLVLTISLVALPWHVQAALAGGPGGFGIMGDLLCAGLALVGSLGGTLAAFVALKAGAESLRRMEF